MLHTLVTLKCRAAFLKVRARIPLGVKGTWASTHGSIKRLSSKIYFFFACLQCTRNNTSFRSSFLFPAFLPSSPNFVKVQVLNVPWICFSVVSCHLPANLALLKKRLLFFLPTFIFHTSLNYLAFSTFGLSSNSKLLGQQSTMAKTPMTWWQMLSQNL